MLSMFEDEHRAPPTLHIMSGVHEGGSALIQESVEYRIGSDVLGDIVVRDEGIAAHSVTVTISHGRVRLESHADQVRVHDKLAVPDGHLCESRLPCAFSIGPVRMRVSMGDAVDGRLVRTKRLRLTIMLPVLFGLAMPFVYFSMPASGKTEQTQSVAALIQAPRQVPSADTVRNNLATRLQTAGLLGLDVNVEGSVVQVSGTLPAAQKAQWREAQAWFDRRYGSNYLLRASLAAAVEPDIFITAVWLGTSPYLIDDKGARRYPGAILNDGWELKSISRQSIVVIRDGQEHIFRL